MKGTAIVTGANRGLGLHVAQGLAQQGYQVVAVCRKADVAEATARDLPGSGHQGVAMDMVNISAESLGKLKAAAPSPKILINNAGALFDGWDPKKFKESMTINCFAPIALTEEFLPLMQEGGVIVQVSSGPLGQLRGLSSNYRKQIEKVQTLEQLKDISFDPNDSQMKSSGVGHYQISKAMLNKATQILAQRPEVQQKNLGVVAVCPGWCQTDMGNAVGPAPRAPEEGAESILWAALHAQPKTCNAGFFQDGKKISW